jgi:seryl-tRNA synthetase
MLDPKFIIENKEKVTQMLKNRNLTLEIEYLNKIENLYSKRNKIIIELDQLRHKRNIESKKIGELKNKETELIQHREELKILSENIKKLEDELKNIESELNSLLLLIPNILDERVPIAPDESGNKVIRYWGEKPQFNFKPRPHWEIGEKNNILDFKRATKLAGSRFTIYKGLGAKIERALINFMLDVHINENKYTEFIPPFIVNSKTMTGTGQLPKFKEDLFKIENFDYYLIPTAEVPLTNIHSDEILEEENLPLYYTAYTPCFRAEAGSWGKDIRGLIRQHQFNKVELVKIVKPENSNAELEKLVSEAEKILQYLGLHYRVVMLSSGDTGFSSGITYDIEVWLPGQNTYREISSCSNCFDFQARRANIKFRRKDTKKVEYVHTLNGSGLAVGRTFIAILENYQKEDGSFEIPSILKKYL